MSSNDQIVIIERGKEFYLYHNLCVDNNFKSSKDNFIMKVKTLRNAIKEAEKICNESPYVEYGYTIELKEKD